MPRFLAVAVDGGLKSCPQPTEGGSADRGGGEDGFHLWKRPQDGDVER